MGVLSHVRIVTIGSSAATSYCARLFADLGADVQKVEPPGDPVRRIVSLTRGSQSACLAFFYKSSIYHRRKDPDSIRLLTRLIEDCDILVDGRDVESSDCPSIECHRDRQAAPQADLLYVSWFGREDPYAGVAATDSTVRALAGLIKLVGPVGETPLRAPDSSPACGVSPPRPLLRLWRGVMVLSSFESTLSQRVSHVSRRSR
ncbi:crotonobetainyl-CoA:carnitine CoA-transferase CaiB-like acyl-CoA transferase [Bradyrhizobium sp. USDA 4354]